jgi:hypothetical protein
VNEVLRAPDTAFFLVATPDRTVVKEALYFAGKLDSSGIPLKAMIMNRVHPVYGYFASERDARSAMKALETEISRRALELGANEEVASSISAKLLRSFRQCRDLSAEERACIEPVLDRIGTRAYREIPYMSGDIHDISGLVEIERHLFE